jgi:peroxiredoxin
MSDFANLDTIVLGVSKDPIASHRRFQERFSLPFPLLSDADSDVCERYGVWKTKKLFGRESKGIERTTFVIDQTGQPMWLTVRNRPLIRRMIPRSRRSTWRSGCRS